MKTLERETGQTGGYRNYFPLRGKVRAPPKQNGAQVVLSLAVPGLLHLEARNPILETPVFNQGCYWLCLSAFQSRCRTGGEGKVQG